MNKRKIAATAFLSMFAISGITLGLSGVGNDFVLARYGRVDVDFENETVLNGLNKKDLAPYAKKLSFMTSDSGKGVNLINEQLEINLEESNIRINKPLTVSFRLKTDAKDNQWILSNKNFSIFLFEGELIVFADGEYYGLNKKASYEEESQITIVKNNDADNGIVFYINGEEKECSVKDGITEIDTENFSESSFILGNESKEADGEKDNYLMIDEFQVYQKALTETQVQSTIRVSRAFGHQDMELKGADRRKERGSNYWLSSNLREWLNSDSQTVRYTSNPPAQGYVNNYPYDKEAGFLANFTQAERDGIAVTERGNLFGASDTAASTNGKTGTVSYNHNSSPSMNFEYPNVLKSWDNYGQVVANDKIFLLTMKETAEYIQHRGWSVMKSPTDAVAKKFGYSTSSKLAYYIYHPIQNIGSEYLEIISSNPNAISMDSDARDARGVAPAMHLKKETTVKRIKAYNTSSVNESWTSTTSTIKAKDLNIGDIVEYGSYLGEAIQWRVINKTSDGYPLLMSEKVIDVKPYDATGDYSRRFSYLDLEEVFPVADVSTTKFQVQNTQGSSDKTGVSFEVVNEEQIFERINNGFTLNIKLSDDSGISYVQFPNGQKVNVNEKTYSFNYDIANNGNYAFGLMDVKGNFRYFILPIGNINLPPKVEVSASNTNWTNSNVTINIKASNDVGWTASSVTQTDRDRSGGSWGNYTTYIGKRIKVNAKVQYVSHLTGFNPSRYSYGPAFTYKKITKSGDEYNLNWTYPYPNSQNLNTLRQRLLDGLGPREIEFIYTVPGDYFGSFGTRLHITLPNTQYGNVTIQWTDVKYELLDNDDFAITKIELPSGSVTNSSSYSEVIKTEGQTLYKYKVHDNRGMVTEKTVTVKIDKTKPTIAVTGNPTSWTTQDAKLNLSFSDALSGIKEIVLPDGRKTYAGEKSVNLDYVVKENGDYTFTVIDQAGNQTSTTVKVTKIDKTVKAVSDITAKMSMVNSTSSTRQIKFEFPAVSDAVSGIKGYSYVIDTNPGTVPDNVVDTTNTVITKEIKDNQTYYLHIKAIDNAGNISITSHAEVVAPTLTAKANNTENMIKLDWTNFESSTYKVYQKKPNSDEFQSIGATFFDDSEKVRVLNIYPTINVQSETTLIPSETFTNWKGQTFTLPESARLKRWMEEPNSENPKGYGKGIIEVDVASIDEFNGDFNKYLAKTNDSYKYDVIMIGSWDYNGNKFKNNELSVESVAKIQEFVDDGHGLLLGHDLISTINKNALNQFKDDIRVEIVSYDNIYGEEIEIEKKGVLTNFPWEIGEIGDTLTIPMTHTQAQICFGDVWLNFSDFGKETINGGRNNVYLTTWNNTAMIQTGHSKGKATADEQKILANTLFYLNQLSMKNSLEDYSGQDVAAPTTPKFKSSSFDEQGRLIMEFEASKDKGSTYEYYVEARSNDGSRTLLSNVAKETILSGLKGYSYVIDSKEKTEPDNEIEIKELKQIVFDKSDFGKYLHIKAVDNGRGGGNSSETLHIKIEGLNLQVKPIPDKNLIRLDWDEVAESNYQVYQKKPGSSEYQSISLTNFDSVEKVRVLNVYPIRANSTKLIPTITFTTYKGETYTLPKSASLKKWMEEPNSESSKGYGKGVIDVTPVSIDEFNDNYHSIMKNSDGSWKYDVIMVGSWDGQANTYPTVSNEAVELIKTYINEGRGFLAGHDTIGYIQGTQSGLGRIRDLFNIKVGKWNWGDGIPDKGHEYFGGFMSSTAILQKKGLLTSYPWNLGEEGAQFSIPISHSTSNFAYGDIWMTYPENDLYSGNEIPSSLYQYANYYLTTWNNTAMIQTGHSNGSATVDEQKILANTLFYLNQLSDNNYLDDYSGQDVAAPTRPTVKNVAFMMNNQINIDITASTDSGSTYSYYVKSEKKDGKEMKTSNTATTTITTGLAGYSYVVDSNPDTIPDNIVDTTSTQIQVPTNYTTKYYFHVKAVDKAGNSSEVTHYELTDMTKPTLVVTADKTQWTNTDVVLTAQATDKESGLKYLYLPDGNKFSQVSSKIYTVSQNGYYTFKAEDYMGNIQTVIKEVGNIDKISPTASIQILNGETRVPSDETTITFSYRDNLSGVAKVEVYDLNAKGQAITPYHVIENPTDSGRTTQWVLKPYDDPNNSSIKKARVGIRVTDKAGNTSTYTSQEVIIESIEITGFSLTNVVNPEIYNEANPFVELSYPNIPVQKMLTGGSFDFKVNYRYSNTIPTTYKMDYQATIYLVGPNGYNKSYPMTMKNQQLSGMFEMSFEIPFDVPMGTAVYVDAEINLKTGAGVLYGTDRFPKASGTRLQIGIIDDDIRNLIKFNEIK